STTDRILAFAVPAAIVLIIGLIGALQVRQFRQRGRQTGEMLGMLEELLLEREPDMVLVYGDTNTTLAAGLAAAKLDIPVAHVEAGLRSFNRAMPEEINRVLVDHISALLLCPTTAAVENLRAEGITEGVHLVGDVMLDTARYFAESVNAAPVLARYGVEPDGYFFATVHRAGNSDDPGKLAAIVSALAALDRPVIWAVHPRTRKNLQAFGLDAVVEASPSIIAIEPVPYTDTVALLRSASALLTDSGGMQKEAYFFGVPCVTMRDETEWVETVELGWNTLVGADTERILAAVQARTKPIARPSVYGDGHAADAIVDVLERHAFV
ncbi:MAG: UDP-N-acetylglucosamine 2-epimerase (non-hydrolyzing), partial [Actinomycetota bacterium]